MKYIGIVQEGSHEGTRFGFPTANLKFEKDDVSGIFAARVYIGRDAYDAAVYADPKNKKLEAHLLDYVGKLYGKEITVELQEKIRETTVFESDAQAKGQIARDVAMVREYFRMH